MQTARSPRRRARPPVGATEERRCGSWLSSLACASRSSWQEHWAIASVRSGTGVTQRVDAFNALRAGVEAVMSGRTGRVIGAALAALLIVASLPNVADALIATVSGQIIKIAPPPS